MSLNEPIKNFEKISNGIYLKDSLIDLLSALLSDSEFIAGNFLGYVGQDFVEKDYLLSEYRSINDALEYTLSITTNDSLYTSLTKISEIKDSIRNAVNDLYGRNVIPSSGIRSYFEKYSDYIRDIPNSISVRTLENSTIEENGEYVADDDKAYGSLLVNVPEKTLTTRVIESNGTYYAQQDGADGYEYVTVAVTGHVEKYRVRFMSSDGSQVLYTALNIPYGGYAQYDAPYPESSTEGEYFVGWNPNPVNVTSNMDCYPVFSALPVDTNEIQDSWETIVANKGAGYPLGSYKYIEFEPTQEIAFKNKYSNGSGPSGQPITHLVFSGIKPIQMIKVAAGEGGSTSTWLNLGKICAEKYYFLYSDGTKSTDMQVYGDPISWFYIVRATTPDSNRWIESEIRSFLNGDFLQLIIPDAIKSAIVPVPKYTPDISEDGVEVISDGQSRDKLWIPSAKEVLGDISRTLTLDGTDSYYADKIKIFDNSHLGLSYDSILFSDETIVIGEETVHPFKDGVRLTSYYYDQVMREIGLRDLGNSILSYNLSTAIDPSLSVSKMVPQGISTGYQYFVPSFGFCL